jgi:hypothetical protein
MYKQILLTCLVSFAAQAAQSGQSEFIFHSPKTSAQTAVVTTSATVGAGVLSYYLLSLFFQQNNIGFKATAPLTDNIDASFSSAFNLSANGLTAVAAAALGAFAGWFTYGYQPEGLFVAARNNLSAAICDQKVNQLIEAGENILPSIDTTYIASAHSRIDAYNDFSTHYIALQHASAWLKSAINSSYDVELVTAAQDYLVIIQDYMAHIANCISIIKSDPNWFKQLKCYEMTKSREAQEQLVVATRMASMDSHHVYVHHDNA